MADAVAGNKVVANQKNSDFSGTTESIKVRFSPCNGGRSFTLSMFVVGMAKDSTETTWRW